MAYITKAEVQEKTVKLKAIAKKYGIKISVSGSNSSTITCTILSGKLDFADSFIRTTKEEFLEDRGSYHWQTNRYHLDTSYQGTALKCLKELYAVMEEGHYDLSDAMSDYFNCAWYMYVNIGKWNKPYILEK